MTVLDFLAGRPPTPASYIARHLGMWLEDVYAELVALEAVGLARVVVEHRPREVKGWEALGVNP